MNKTIEVLTVLATDYETKAAALRGVIADLTDAHHANALARLPGKLRAATKQRAAERNGDAPTHTERMAARRDRVVAALVALAERPRTLAELGIGNGGVNKWASLGLVKRSDGGFYRLTAKGRRVLADYQAP